MNTKEILRKYDPIAKKAAWEHRLCGLDLEDLQQTARLGMMKCLSSFDSEKGALPTHLIWGARAALTEYIRQTALPIAVKSRQQRAVVMNVGKAICAAEARGLDATEARLQAAEDLQTTVSAVDKALGVMGHRRGDDALAVMPSETTESWIEQSDRWTALMNAFTALTDEEREVVIAREVEGVSQREIAEKLCISRPTIRKRHQSGMKKIREQMKDYSFSDFF